MRLHLKASIGALLVALLFTLFGFQYDANAAISCSQAKKSILAEEKNGFEAWKKFDVFRNKLPRALKVSDVRKYIALITPVLQSDTKVFALARKSSNCLNAKTMEIVAKGETETKGVTNSFLNLLTSVKKLPESSLVPNSEEIYQAFKAYYSEFWEIISYKRISSPAPTPKPSQSTSSDSSLQI